MYFGLFYRCVEGRNQGVSQAMDEGVGKCNQGTFTMYQSGCIEGYLIWCVGG